MAAVHASPVSAETVRERLKATGVSTRTPLIVAVRADVEGEGVAEFIWRQPVVVIKHEAATRASGEQLDAPLFHLYHTRGEHGLFAQHEKTLLTTCYWLIQESIDC